MTCTVDIQWERAESAVHYARHSASVEEHKHTCSKKWLRNRQMTEIRKDVNVEHQEVREESFPL